MKKRIFIAIDLSESLQKEILRWERKLHLLPVRWLAGKNLHITLIPPWYAEEKKIAKIEKILNGVGKKIRLFEISFEKVNFGPSQRQPRLIWAEGKAPEELLRLKSRLKKALGQEPEKHPFLPHLTLARFRPEYFGTFKVKTLNERVEWKEKVSKFVLMESHLSRSGADYEVLAETKLNAKEK